MSVIDIEQDRHALATGINGVESAIPASLLELLSPPNETDIDLESPSAKAYIDRLVSLGLDNLEQEPSTISNERSAVDLELVNLCYREYSTFTSVHQCSAAIGAAFDDFDNSLDKLIESIPALEDECRQFGKGTSEIQKARKKAVLLQEHEDKLLDVLEIPQLMETCVRNGYYQEALELSSHVSTLREKHHAIIIDDVADEANGILQLMTAQLLGVLREPVKLPALIKAIGYLRKLQDLDDVQLGLAFLSSRLVNYRARLIEIEKDRAEPVRYLRRYIDLFREHVFDIISQYTTIFTAVDADQLASFVNLCVDDLCQLVHRYIPRIASDSPAMSSILVQLGYCSLSFARVGLDFSALLIDPFKSAVQSSYDQAVAAAATTVKTTLAIDAQAAAAPPQSLVSAYHLQQILSDPHSPPQTRHEADSHTPPAVLAHFPPIAQFLNAHLAALNALRLLAPSQSQHALQTSQATSIQQATSAVLDYVEQAVSTETSGELSRTGSRHRHTRSNSTPRAHLIRRNTETLLSAETLAAKRRESKRICVAFADAWQISCEFLAKALGIVLETQTREVLDGTKQQLKEWIEANRERDLDGGETKSKQVNGDTLTMLDEDQENGHTDANGVPDVEEVFTAPGLEVASAPATAPEPVALDVLPVEAVPEGATPGDSNQPQDIPITPEPITMEDLPSTPVPTDVELAQDEGKTDVIGFGIATEPLTPALGIAEFTEPTVVPSNDPVRSGSAPDLADPLPAPIQSSIVPEEHSQVIEKQESVAAVANTVEVHTDVPAGLPEPIAPTILDEQEIVDEPINGTHEPKPVVLEDSAISDTTPTSTVQAVSTSTQAPEPTAFDSPPANAPEQESGIPEDENVDGPQSGTVTPTADPNAPESNGPKTNKKKKKKKGKK